MLVSSNSLPSLKKVQIGKQTRVAVQAVLPRRPKKKPSRYLNKMSEKGKSIKNKDIPNKHKITKKKKARSNKCVVCGDTYKRKDDTGNPWVACEHEQQCHTWGHMICVGWEEYIGEDVAQMKYYCPECMFAKV